MRMVDTEIFVQEPVIAIIFTPDEINPVALWCFIVKVSEADDVIILRVHVAGGSIIYDALNSQHAS